MKKLFQDDLSDPIKLYLDRGEDRAEITADLELMVMTMKEEDAGE